MTKKDHTKPDGATAADDKIDLLMGERVQMPEEEPAEAPAATNEETAALQKENEELKAKLAEAHDKSLRAAAELENFRKRMTKETEDRIKYSNAVVLESLLPVIDNLEMALAHFSPDTPVEKLKEGVELTLRSFGDTLGKFGLTAIASAVGDPFDPALHDAMMLDANPDMDTDTVTLVLQKGYRLHDRVIRPAKVKVNKK